MQGMTQRRMLRLASMAPMPIVASSLSPAARAAIGGDADPISGMETVVERNAAETSGRDTEIGFDVRILIAL